MRLNHLITCFLDNLWILWGEVTHLSLLGDKGLNKNHKQMEMTHDHLNKVNVLHYLITRLPELGA